MRQKRSVWITAARLFAFFAVFSPIISYGENVQSSLTDLFVHVAGSDPVGGRVNYALYNSAKYFPTHNGRLFKGQVNAFSKRITITIKGLRPGYYAMALYHDENFNQEFDQGWFGIPLENYGFSNDARGIFRAPSFEDAKFLVKGRKTEITVNLSR